MSDTREKLLESKYFLKRMTETQADRDAFKYNLSAFLAAARSVTDIMKTEFDKATGFGDWKNETLSKIEKCDAMKFFNDKRKKTIHIQPVRPHAQVNVDIAEHMPLSDSVSIVLTHPDGTVERRESETTLSSVPAKNETITEWLWYFG